MSLYSGYFAGKMGLDPSGNKIVSACKIDDLLKKHKVKSKANNGAGKSGYFYNKASAKLAKRSWHKKNEYLNLDDDELTKEILVRMINEKYEFVLDCTAKGGCVEALEKHIASRLQIVASANEKEFRWVYSPNRPANPATGEAPTTEVVAATPHNFPEMQHNPYMIYQSCNNSGTYLGCNAASMMVFYSGMNENLTKPGYPSSFRKRRPRSQWIPGDWGYIYNKARTNANAGEWSSGLVGENIIYMGYELFWGHLTDDNQIYDLLEDENSTRESWMGHVNGWSTLSGIKGKADLRKTVDFPTTGIKGK